MNRKCLFLLLLIIFAANRLQSQDLDLLLQAVSTDSTPDLIHGTFKGTTIIHGQSVEVPGNKDLLFIISHRFGAVNTGLYNFFGLDQGTTRLGLEYGIKDIAGIAIGRSSYEKTYDGAFKLKLMRQQSGIKNIPLTVTLYSAICVKSLKWEDPQRDNLFSSRLSYSTQLLIARKFNKNLSFQVSPSFVHFNLVATPEDQNNIFSIGMGGRYKLGPKFSINGEYFYLLPGKTADDYANSLSFGVDMETGGHVFQLHFTNSQLMFAPGYIARTDGVWSHGDIFIGFNIYRIFPLNKQNKNLH